MPNLIAGKKLISFDGGGKDVTVPAHVEEITTNAFFECSNIVHLTIPETVNYIGDYAFKLCYNLKRIDLPKVVDEIGDGLFMQCWLLESVTFPEGIETIGKEMFSECKCLTAVSIPDTIKKIDNMAFSSCESLRRLRINPNILDVIPREQMVIAVLTYMVDNHANGNTNEVINSFSKDNSIRLASLAIKRDEKEAVHYMIDHNLIEASDIMKLLSAATDFGRTEIIAMLLEQKSKIASKEDSFEWDPF